MQNYYIYHVPGIKIGATKEWNKRSRYNLDRYEIEPIILETMEGPDDIDFWQVVGDREWELADSYGYDRGTHYKVIRIKASKHDWCDTARQTAKDNGSQSKAGLVGGSKNNELSKIEGTKSYKARKKYQSSGGKALAKLERTCPHCSKTGKGVVMGRWHFDNCKKK